MSRSLLIRAVGLLCSFAGSSQATVRLPELLGDHMVLRQNAEVSLWGFACAGETVQVEASSGAKTQAVVNAQGYWRLKVKTPAAQPLSKGLHPETITFTSSQGNNVQVKDVLIGEVWLASGQSNMKMWLMPCYPPGNNGWYGEKFWSEAHGGECLKAKRPGLRLFNVEQSPSTISQTDCRSAMPDHMPRPRTPTDCCRTFCAAGNLAGATQRTGSVRWRITLRPNCRRNSTCRWEWSRVRTAARASNRGSAPMPCARCRTLRSLPVPRTTIRCHSPAARRACLTA